MESQSASTKGVRARLGNRSLVAEHEREDPRVIWGGAEGEAQERLKKHDELLDEEARQIGVLIR